MEEIILQTDLDAEIVLQTDMDGKIESQTDIGGEIVLQTDMYGEIVLQTDMDREIAVQTDMDGRGHIADRCGWRDRGQTDVDREIILQIFGRRWEGRDWWSSLSRNDICGVILSPALLGMAHDADLKISGAFISCGCTVA